MCGRFALGIPKKRLEEVFETAMPDDYAPRYNVAPGHELLVVTPGGAGWRTWGLVPHWAKEAKGGMINARSETVFEKPSFRDAVRSSRCLVPAQVFYEWQQRGKVKFPFAINIKEMDVFAMAGIMSHWQDATTGEVIDSCAILTCEPNALMAPIHDRMPVILPPESWKTWLDPVQVSPESLTPLLKSYSAQSMRVWPVSSAVNSVANDDPDLLVKVEIPPQQQGSLL